MLQICEQGCAALCMLALRKPENCSVIMEGGGALAALQAMKAHPREVAVQVWPPWPGGSAPVIWGCFCFTQQSLCLPAKISVVSSKTTDPSASLQNH